MMQDHAVPGGEEEERVSFLVKFHTGENVNQNCPLNHTIFMGRRKGRKEVIKYLRILLPEEYKNGEGTFGISLVFVVAFL
jgi:hypothetical protein